MLNLSASPAVQEADVVVLFVDDDQTKDDFRRGMRTVGTPWSNAGAIARRFRS